MDIILNTESLSPPLTGIGHYTLHLLRGLARHPEVDSIRRFDGPADIAAFERQLESDGAGEASTNGGWQRQLKNFVRGLPGAYPLRAWLRERQFARSFGAETGAVYHEPNYILKRYGGPCVATVHDSSHIAYPQFHPRERVAYLERHLAATIARADQLITLSEFMRTELIAHFCIAPERISAIHLGVDDCFRQRPEEETAAVLLLYGLRHGGYLLSVATLEPRKNLIRLLRAYARLAPALRRRYPLVLAGAPGWHTSPLAMELRSLAVASDVRLVGYVPARHLPQLYSGAAGFGLVSLFEGFGLPALEAMASGTPLLASTRSALPEVAGDAALYAEPEDVDQIAVALERLLEDGALRARLVSAGLVRAAQFKWESCVEQTVAVYRRALA